MESETKEPMAPTMVLLSNVVIICIGLAPVYFLGSHGEGGFLRQDLDAVLFVFGLTLALRFRREVAFR